ncbi:hypothetical protein OUZ56_031366 [Daphnia magna]|uniref:Uncharacterized protein n=1 Tax=Daphnia magna TaxID=35525 RepID=A0ABQ9ZU13_9CRUS|nr:hypothetical protein OUZ56_031366 [Daphnia magna]
MPTSFNFFKATIAAAITADVEIHGSPHQLLPQLCPVSHVYITASSAISLHGDIKKFTYISFI